MNKLNVKPVRNEEEAAEAQAKTIENDADKKRNSRKTGFQINEEFQR